MSSYFSHLFRVPYLPVTAMYGNEDSRVSEDSVQSRGDICQRHTSSKKPQKNKNIHMHIEGATLITQRE